jgi:hypothetical protein
LSLNKLVPEPVILWLMDLAHFIEDNRLWIITSKGVKVRGTIDGVNDAFVVVVVVAVQYPFDYHFLLLPLAVVSFPLLV